MNHKGDTLLNRRRTRIRRWVLSHTPEWLREHSFEIFVSLLCLFAGIPLIFGRVDPRSLEAALPTPLVLVWGLILTLGPIAMLSGVIGANRGNKPLEERVFYARIEAWGLSALAYASYIYAGAILSQLSGAGWVASMLVIAFGGTCHIREIDIQLRITEIRAGVGLS